MLQGRLRRRPSAAAGRRVERCLSGAGPPPGQLSLWPGLDPIVARLFVLAASIAGAHARLTGPDVRHLRALRLPVGAQITLFDDQGREHDAVVRRIGSRAADLDIRASRLVPIPSGPPITLIAGVLKGQRMAALVEKATELGVMRIVPALTEFTVARPAGPDTARTQRWRRIAVSAATQSGRSQVPVVDMPMPFADAVRTTPAGALGVLFWEHEPRVALAAIHGQQPHPPAIVVAVGPEGGFTTAEVECARSRAFQVSGLGPRTLRAETAALIGVALCQAFWGDLRAPDT